jgi:hypothetical protein
MPKQIMVVGEVGGQSHRCSCPHHKHVSEQTEIIMSYHVHDTNLDSVKNLACGFIAGFAAVLVFHQPTLGLLHLAGITPGMPYALRPTAPLGVPAVLSAAFWGGIWGIVFATLDRRFPRGAGYWTAAFLFGAVAPTLVGWFIVLPVKGTPVGNGWHTAGMLTAVMVNGAWGIGTALLRQVCLGRLWGRLSGV